MANSDTVGTVNKRFATPMASPPIPNSIYMGSMVGPFQTPSMGILFWSIPKSIYAGPS